MDLLLPFLVFFFLTFLFQSLFVFCLAYPCHPQPLAQAPILLTYSVHRTNFHFRLNASKGPFHLVSKSLTFGRFPELSSLMHLLFQVTLKKPSWLPNSFYISVRVLSSPVQVWHTLLNLFKLYIQLAKHRFQLMTSHWTQSSLRFCLLAINWCLIHW